jgi:hypothetical protein
MLVTKKMFFLMIAFCFLFLPFSNQLSADDKREEETESVLSKQPQIAIDAVKHDAGEVWEGDVVSHDFVVKNTGTSELTISRVKPG